MRTVLALLVTTALALVGATQSAAQEGGLNERTKTLYADTGAADGAGTGVAPDLQRLAISAANAADDGDAAEAERLFGNLRADARFDGQPAVFRAAVLSAAGYVATQAADYETARQHFTSAIDTGEADMQAWHLLSQVQAGQDLFDDAARSLATIARKWPKRLDELRDDHYWRVIHQAKPDSKEREDLLQALYDAGWTRDALGGPSGAWYELALVRIRQGDMDAVRQLLPGIDGPRELVRMRSDRRFDAVIDRDDPTFDPRLAADRKVEVLAAQSARFPGRLDTVAEHVAAMLIAGQHDQALARLDEVIAAQTAATQDAPAFTDTSMYSWILDQRATTLRRLGRIDEATEQMVAASRVDEGRLGNVSQALNLGQLYASLGRPDDALAALDSVGDNISSFGLMVKASVQQRAAIGKGDDVAAKAALDLLREHRDTSEAVYLESLVEADQLDEAAALVISQLIDEGQRADMLDLLQDVRESPVLPGSAAVDARWKRLVARKDVQAAVAKVGRILTYDIYGLR